MRPTICANFAVPCLTFGKVGCGTDLRRDRGGPWRITAPPLWSSLGSCSSGHEDVLDDSAFCPHDRRLGRARSCLRVPVNDYGLTVAFNTRQNARSTESPDRNCEAVFVARRRELTKILFLWQQLVRGKNVGGQLVQLDVGPSGAMEKSARHHSRGFLFGNLRRLD